MIRFVLDTDILSLLQDRHPVVVQKVAACPPAELAITVISVEEQLSGWYTRLRRAKKPDQLARAYLELTTNVSSLAQLPFVSFGEAAIRRWEALRKRRVNIGKMDVRIA